MEGQTATADEAPAFAFMETDAVRQAIGAAGEALVDVLDQSALVEERFNLLSENPTPGNAEEYLHELDRQLERERAAVEAKAPIIAALRQSFAELGLTESQR